MSRLKFGPGMSRGYILWNRRPPFHVDCCPRHGNKRANNPHEQGEAHTARERQNRPRSRKYARSNDAVEYQQCCAEYTQLSTILG